MIQFVERANTQTMVFSKLSLYKNHQQKKIVNG